MSEHHAGVSWDRRGADFMHHKYSRSHLWTFDGGASVPASASPHLVPAPYSDAAGVDPEEAFVAALSSCHMLWFLAIAAKRGYAIESYRDEAVGKLEKDGEGRLAITTVTLRPHVVFGSDGREVATEAAVRQLHDAAHHECFLASSVRTQIITEPTFAIT
jgi:organic hydroperoxide reductase OsmC/OhrA